MVDDPADEFVNEGVFAYTALADSGEDECSNGIATKKNVRGRCEYGQTLTNPAC